MSTVSGSEPVDTRKQPVLVVGDWTYYRSTRHGGEFAAYCTTDPYARALDNPHEVALLDEVLRLRARNEKLERENERLREAGFLPRSSLAEEQHLRIEAQQQRIEEALSLLREARDFAVTMTLPEMDQEAEGFEGGLVLSSHIDAFLEQQSTEWPPSRQPGWV